MKKWLILEILFLTVVIVVAVGVCTNLPAAAPGFHPETPTQESSTADTSQTPQTPLTPQFNFAQTKKICIFRSDKSC